MEKTERQLIIVFAVLIFTLDIVAIIYYGKTGGSLEKEEAAQKAKEIYKRDKASGIDFSNGPCIAEELMPGRLADVAHDPRQEVDNLAENQCRNYREVKTHHFTELDTEGNIMRAK